MCWIGWILEQMTKYQFFLIFCLTEQMFLNVDVFNPQTNQWEGPKLLLTWGKGYACIVAGTGENATWIPVKWVRPHLKDFGKSDESNSEPQLGPRSNEEGTWPLEESSAAVCYSSATAPRNKPASDTCRRNCAAVGCRTLTSGLGAGYKTETDRVSEV